MIKKIYNIIAICLGMIVFDSCSKYEMIKYSESPCINFMGTDLNGRDTDDTTTLKASLNFGMNVKGDAVILDTIMVGVKVQGMIPDRDMRVLLTVEGIEGTESPEIVFMERYIIQAGKYSEKLGVPVKRPKMRSKEYKCNLVFDFGEGNDFNRGTAERQKFALTIIDEVTLKLCGLSEDDWNNWGPRTIGEYSENKLRFMIVVMETSNFANIAYYGPNATMQKKLRDALAEYNAQNPENPLRDENGKLISFNV